MLWSYPPYRRIIGLALFLILLPALFSSSAGKLEGLSNSTSGLSLASVPTYESIGVYLSFSEDANANNQATFEYRVLGTSRWIQGMAMTPDRREIVRRDPNPYYNQWRASILMAQPDTDYEIRVTVTDVDGVTGSPVIGTVKTRTDQVPSIGRSIYVSPTGTSLECSDGAIFAEIQPAVDCTQPGDTVYIKAGTYNGGVVILNHGEADNYITVRNFEDDKVVVLASLECGKWGTCGILIAGNYVRLKGLEIVGGRRGIIVGPPKESAPGGAPHDVIVEDNIVRDDKTLSSVTVLKYEAINLGGSSAGWNTDVHNITIQRNTIIIVEPGTADKTLVSGPAIVMKRADGGHVIRGNTMTFIGTVDIHGMDCINSKPNNVFNRTLHDTDIYDNFCDGTTDDGISMDGNGANVRIWNNAIKGATNAISITPVLIGPVYIFRNTFYEPQQHWTSKCGWIKGGQGSTGYVYIYHNTVVYDDRTAYGYGLNCVANYGLSLDAGANAESSNVFMLNNIIETDGPIASESDRWPQMDYDLLYNYLGEPGASTHRNYWIDWGGLRITGSSETRNAEYFAAFQSESCAIGNCQEVNGIAGKSSFLGKASGDFRLAPDSLAINKGAFIQGFNDFDSAWPYSGSAPDIGAMELSEGSTILINLGDEFTSSESVTLNMACFTENGVKDVRYGNDGAFGPYEPFSPVKSWTLPSDDGVHTVAYECRDNLNVSTSASDSIILETSPPIAPTGISLSPVSTSRIDLSWSAASDPESGISGYRVYRDGALIGNTTLTSFSDTGLEEGTAYTYQVSAVNGVDLETMSAPVSESTLDDITPPVIINVVASDVTVITVIFSEPLETTSAESTSNYAVGNGVTISGAALQSDSKIVNLNVSTLSEGVTYKLTVNGVRDWAGNPIAADTIVDFSVVLGPPAYYELDGVAVVEAEHYAEVDQRSDDINWVLATADAGFAGEGYMWTVDGTASNGDWASNAELAFAVNISTPGEYFIAARHRSPNSASNSAFVGVDGVAKTAIKDFTTVSDQWVWTRGPSLGALDAGPHTIQIRRREDGFQFDRVMIADSLAKLPVNGSTEAGPPESLTGPGRLGVANATDLDGDGLFEDVNGNGTLDFTDVVTLFENMQSSEVQNNISKFDYNGNARIDFMDIVLLFKMIVS